MTPATRELLDLSDPRYWQQNARMAVQDVYDALVEIITNADDRYCYLERTSGRIEIEVERRRKGTPSIIRVRDFADGMTIKDMRSKLLKVGGRVSGMAQGKFVRGTNSRGAKDVAILGGVTFESIAGDGKYHKCEITKRREFISHESMRREENLYCQQLKIPEGTGTVVSIQVDPDVSQVPQHDTLLRKLGRLVPLRDILVSPYREVVLIDPNKGRQDRVMPPTIEGHDRIKETFEVPGYAGVSAKLVVKRADRPLEEEGVGDRFRLGAILVKSRHAIHEATLFASDLQNDPHAKWFYGKLTCEYIDDLSNEFDELYEQGLPLKPSNPTWLIDPLRKQGLRREHPFVKALYGEALKRLRPLVEEERTRAEKNQAKIESDDTRKRLRALEKAAAKFLRENQEEDDTGQNPEDVGPIGKKGFFLNPPFAQIVVRETAHFCLNAKQEDFPELAKGDTVEISCATDEIRSSKAFDVLEPHPSQQGILRSAWTVTGVKATKATAVKARVGPIVAESVVEVVETEREKYAEFTTFCFSKKRYTVKVGKPKRVVLYARCPDEVSERTRFEIQSPNQSFAFTGERVLVPRPELGVAVCCLHVKSQKPEERAVVTATCGDMSCQAVMVSIEALGISLDIQLKDEDFRNQRYTWKPGNHLLIAARHPALHRYLGPPKAFAGQEERHFRVLLAEIVAEAICSRLLGQNEEARPQEYRDADWDTYYAEYTKLLTQFLPVAHQTQVEA